MADYNALASMAGLDERFAHSVDRAIADENARYLAAIQSVTPAELEAARKFRADHPTWKGLAWQPDADIALRIRDGVLRPGVD